MEFLEFVFQSFWHFIGVLIFICAPFAIIASAISGIGCKEKSKVKISPDDIDLMDVVSEVSKKLKDKDI